MPLRLNRIVEATHDPIHKEEYRCLAIPSMLGVFMKTHIGRRILAAMTAITRFTGIDAMRYVDEFRDRVVADVIAERIKRKRSCC